MSFTKYILLAWNDDKVRHAEYVCLFFFCVCVFFFQPNSFQKIQNYTNRAMLDRQLRTPEY